MEKRIYEVNESDWKRLRPDLTKGILGAPLVPADAKTISVTLTRVEPKGEFPPHRDAHHHVFYFFKGWGEGAVGGEQYAIKPGIVVQIPAGMVHGYRNSGDEEMLLLTLNISAD